MVSRYILISYASYDVITVGLSPYELCYDISSLMGPCSVPTVRGFMHDTKSSIFSLVVLTTNVGNFLTVHKEQFAG